MDTVGVFKFIQHCLKLLFKRRKKRAEEEVYMLPTEVLPPRTHPLAFFAELSISNFLTL